MCMLPTATAIFEIYEDNAASKPPQKYCQSPVPALVPCK